jgi:two-component system, cell cycle sensor histidine kinase and response regulator CckA
MLLNVLIVEDSEDDLLLLLRSLRQGGYEVNHVRVETAETMSQALDSQAWDVVISDYTMPMFNALEALKVLQSKQLDLPFIIVSGTIGEETAVAAMKAGAQDYLLKGNLTRLVPAVERELREASDRKRRHDAEQALEVSEDRFRTLFASAPLAIFHCNAQGDNIYINPLWESIFGLSAKESLGDRWFQAIHPDDREAVKTSWRQTITHHNSWASEHRLLTPQGKTRWVRMLLSPMDSAQGDLLGYVGTVEDITEKKQLETQFLRAQRLESLGTMASGIAHDLNNILTPIIGIVQLLPLRVPNLDDKSKRLLQILNDSTRRGADLVKQILSFTRGIEGKPSPIQIMHLLQEVHNIIYQTFPKAIEISLDYPENLSLIVADVTLLHQVLMNLCVNARDAMPNGGQLLISAENVTIDEHYARLHLDARVGDYVMVTIADNGTGIPSEILDQIFDPFFTTKDNGKGTGLGLSTVLGIVKSHRGFINVESVVNQRTRFNLYFPVTARDELFSPIHSSTPIGNGELILVVDDEKAIQEITQETLETHHYRVMTASDGIEAIELYNQYHQDISVVLLDLMMPTLDSLTIIRTLKKINPQVQIIAMSGLATPEAVSHVHREGIQSFLAKPFTASELLSLLPRLISE